jgi:DNA-binding IclR family transcriptional regulator
LRILEIYQELREPLSAKAVAEALGMPRSSTNALLRSMIGTGYLSYDELEGTYFPTFRLFYLGSWLMEGHFNDPALASLLQAIWRGTSETVCLWVRLDFDMVAVDVINGKQPITLYVKTGSRAPLFRSVVGAAWLSANPEETVKELAGRHNASRPQKVDIPKLLNELDQVRIEGFAEGYDRWLRDAGAIASTLIPKNFLEPVVVGVGGPDYRIRRNARDIKDTLTEQLAITSRY